MGRTDIEFELGEAVRLRRSGRVLDARRHLDAVLAIDPDQPVARNILGMDALSAGDGRLAADHFMHACRGDPAAGELWLNLATAHRMAADRGAERSALEQALSLDRRNLLALIRLAQLHESLGEETAATQHWSAVLALSAAVEQPSREFIDMLAHASAYVENQRGQLAKILDAAYEDEMSSASSSDRRRTRAAIDAMLGRRTIYANECHGLHYPFLPADEFFDRDHFPWLATLEAGTAEIRSELEAILAERDPGLTPYIEQPSGVPENKWTPLDRSPDWSVVHLWRDGTRIDEACARAPKTMALVESLPLCRIPGRAPAVFFSILKAGKHIPPHTGVTNVRSIVHLPLIVPESCSFRVGGETRPWIEGEAFVFDDTIEHEAHNPTAEDRAVLILDCWNPYLSDTERAMICRIYEASDAHNEAGMETSVNSPIRAG